MSAQRKLTGNSELTRFKILWRDSLSESARDFWRTRLISADTQLQIRKEIHTKLKINLHRDDQLSAFRDWLDKVWDVQAAEAIAAEQDRKDLDEHGLKGELLRTELLDRMKRRALSRGDFKLGLSAIDRDIKAEQVSLDKNKFEFDAAKACLARLPQLKAIATNKDLSEDEKLEQARLALFGSAPK